MYVYYIFGLHKHTPSQMKIEGHRALISYIGQLMTCYGCSEQGTKSENVHIGGRLAVERPTTQQIHGRI